MESHDVKNHITLRETSQTTPALLIHMCQTHDLLVRWILGGGLRFPSSLKSFYGHFEVFVFAWTLHWMPLESIVTAGPSYKLFFQATFQADGVSM